MYMYTTVNTNLNFSTLYSVDMSGVTVSPLFTVESPFQKLFVVYYSCLYNKAYMEINGSSRLIKFLSYRENKNIEK